LEHDAGGLQAGDGPVTQPHRQLWLLELLSDLLLLLLLLLLLGLGQQPQQQVKQQLSSAIGILALLLLCVSP
jgi:hypothetical protein